MRFTLRRMMLGVALAAICIALGQAAYDVFLVPRIPITWRKCRPEDLRGMPGSKPRLICLAFNGTMTGSFYDVQSQCEQPCFRKFVAQEGIECWRCDLTNDNLEPLVSLESEWGLEFLELPPWLILIRGRAVYVHPFRGMSDAEETTESLQIAFNNLVQNE